MNDHRNRMAEKFKNRVDYCDMSAFGVNFKQIQTQEINAQQMDFMINETTGLGRLKTRMMEVNRQLESILYMIVGQAYKYDLHFQNIFGHELEEL